MLILRTDRRGSFDNTVSSTPLEPRSIVPLNAGPAISSIIARKSRSAAVTLVSAIATGTCRYVAAPGAGRGRTREAGSADLAAANNNGSVNEAPARTGIMPRRPRRADGRGARKHNGPTVRQCVELLVLKTDG